MCKRVWKNLRPSFSKLDTLLAWFAIFIWWAAFTKSFTGLDGIINIVERLTSGNWLNWKPIVGGVWYMYVTSGLYWVGAVMAVLVFILLIRKICMKHKEDEPIERIEGTLIDIKKSIDNLASEVRPETESRNTTKKKAKSP